VPAEIHVRLADVYSQMKSYDKAYSELKCYLRAEPQGRFAAKATSGMQQMEGAGVVHTPHASEAPAAGQKN